MFSNFFTAYGLVFSITLKKLPIYLTKHQLFVYLPKTNKIRTNNRKNAQLIINIYGYLKLILILESH